MLAKHCLWLEYPRIPEDPGNSLSSYLWGPWSWCWCDAEVIHRENRPISCFFTSTTSPQTPHGTEWSLVYFQFLWPFYLCLWEIPDVTRLSYTVGRQSQPTLLKLNSNFVLDICPSLNYLSFVRLQTLPSPQRPQASEEPVIPLDGFPLQLSHHSTGSLGSLDSFILLFCLVLENILLE